MMTLSNTSQRVEPLALVVALGLSACSSDDVVPNAQVAGASATPGLGEATASGGSGAQGGSSGATSTGATTTQNATGGSTAVSGTGGQTQSGGTGGANSTGGAATNSGIGGSGASGMAETGGQGLSGGVGETGGSGDGTGGQVAAGGATATGGEGQSIGGQSPTGGSGGAAGQPLSGGAGSHAGPWRITPLGDSITGTTCYPQLLSQLLIDAGRDNFAFEGSQLNNQACDGAPNVQTEGHGGYLVTQLLPGGAHASELSTWCADNQAEIVLMHFATNDLWNSTIPSDTILDAFSLVVQAYRDVNPGVIFLVAQIIPNAGCSTCGESIPAFNSALVGWAAAETTAASPVHLVDQYTGFDPAVDTGDGTHPNVPGSQKMAERWADALAAHGLL